MTNARLPRKPFSMSQLPAASTFSPERSRAISQICTRHTKSDRFMKGTRRGRNGCAYLDWEAASHHQNEVFGHRATTLLNCKKRYSGKLMTGLRAFVRTCRLLALAGSAGLQAAHVASLHNTESHIGSE